MTSSREPPRLLEPGIVTDLRDRLTYGGYLQLDRLLSAQQPLSAPGNPTGKLNGRSRSRRKVGFWRTEQKLKFEVGRFRFCPIALKN